MEASQRGGIVRKANIPLFIGSIMEDLQLSSRLYAAIHPLLLREAMVDAWERVRHRYHTIGGLNE